LITKGVTGLRQIASITNPITATTQAPSTTPSTSTSPSTSTAPSTTRQSTCSIEVNINYQGNDIGGQGSVLSATDCCNLCFRTANCFAWSYFVQYNYCYLKGSAVVLNRQIYNGMVSGVTNK
jgi:hypothetical protein